MNVDMVHQIVIKMPLVLILMVVLNVPVLMASWEMEELVIRMVSLHLFYQNYYFIVKINYNNALQ